MRRLSTAMLAAAAIVAGLAVLGVQPALAQPEEPTSVSVGAPVTSTLQVVKISGLLDPILANFLATSVDEAESSGAIGLLLQVNSTGSVISDDSLRALATKLHESKVPIVAWVGPSGARAEGGMAQLLATVDKVGVAPGSTIGNMGDPVVPVTQWSRAFAENQSKLRNEVVGSDVAKRMRIAPKDALVLRQVLLQVPGLRIQDGTTSNGRKVTATQLVFSQLPTGSGMMHTVASPAVAYLLFALGLGLIVFELFTAGVGIAGFVGAVFFVLGSYGLWVLPTRGIAIALLVASMVASSVDIQVGVPRVWTGIGIVLFTAGSLLMYDGLPTPWLAAVGGIIGMVLFTVYAMPAMTRTRFSTPTIDREWLVGQSGQSVDELAPDGVVQVGGGMWAGRVSNGAAIAGGAAIKVVGVDGTVVEVAVDTD